MTRKQMEVKKATVYHIGIEIKINDKLKCPRKLFAELLQRQKNYDKFIKIVNKIICLQVFFCQELPTLDKILVANKYIYIFLKIN